jgi:hypothetical protein
MSAHVHQWHDAPDWHWPAPSGEPSGARVRTIECTPCRRLRVLVDVRCIFTGCVATWEHSHGGFPGGYDNPDDPTGAPIAFVGPDPDPTRIRDYNGAPL